MDFSSSLKLINQFLEGKIYDSEDPALVLYQITSFITTYNIRLDELLEPNINKYLVPVLFSAQAF